MLLEESPRRPSNGMAVPSKTICVVAGARPNFPKVAPLIRALASYAPDIQVKFIHTGQHYDYQMSGSFVEQLGLPQPDAFLDCGAGSQAVQTASVMVKFEEFLRSPAGLPDGVVVVGDVNSTLACTIAASKLGVPVFHVEAGLRSFDRSMPEEINRLLTDSISTLHLTHSPDAVENLLREGHPASSIKQVGNLMIDTLVDLLPKAQKVEAPGRFGLLTLHRPANVDNPENLRLLLEGCSRIAERWDAQLLFPAHPRLSDALASILPSAALGNILIDSPRPYLEFIWLLSHCEFVLTDSGGIQEEASYLGVPCYTLRDNTERPITVTLGTNRLVGSSAEGLFDRILEVAQPASPTPNSIPGWDGRAADRAAAAIAEYLQA